MKSLLKLLQRKSGTPIKFSDLSVGDKYEISHSMNERIVVLLLENKGIIWIAKSKTFAYFSRGNASSSDNIIFKGYGEVTEELINNATTFAKNLYL